jgi:hypothetical protein
MCIKTCINAIRHGIRARVTDGALVARFQKALTPIVVRVDLNTIGNATLALTPVGTDYALGFMQGKVTAIPLATFDTREAAETAHAVVAGALLCGSSPRRFLNGFKTAAGVIVAIMLGLWIISLVAGATAPGFHEVAMDDIPAMQDDGAEGSAEPETLNLTPPVKPAPRAADDGVPMSAEDYLNQ